MAPAAAAFTGPCCARAAWAIASPGDQHRGIYLQWTGSDGGERHHLDFVDLTGRSVWVSGQTEVQKDLVAARTAAGQKVHYEVSDTAPHDLQSDQPSVTHRRGRRRAADHRRRGGRLRRLVRAEPARRTRPVHLGEDLSLLLAGDACWRRAVDGRADLRLPPRRLRDALHALAHRFAPLPPGARRTDVADWSDDRIWEALATRLGHGQDGWQLNPGPITDKSVLPMRSFVSTPRSAGSGAAHTSRGG